MSDVSFTGKEYEERNKQFVQLIIDNGCMKTYVKLIKLLSDKKLDTLTLQLGNESPKPTGLKSIDLQNNDTKFILLTKNLTKKYQPYNEIPYKLNGVLKKVQ